MKICWKHLLILCSCSLLFSAALANDAPKFAVTDQAKFTKLKCSEAQIKEELFQNFKGVKYSDKKTLASGKLKIDLKNCRFHGEFSRDSLGNISFKSDEKETGFKFEAFNVTRTDVLIKAMIDAKLLSPGNSSNEEEKNQVPPASTSMQAEQARPSERLGPKKELTPSDQEYYKRPRPANEQKAAKAPAPSGEQKVNKAAAPKTEPTNDYATPNASGGYGSNPLVKALPAKNTAR